jgi:hypothetical protein
VEAMARCAPKGSSVSWRTQDERGPPKAITANKFFAAEIGRTPFQLSRKMLALLVALIGKRKKPRANGEPGFIWIDTVHQGDQDKQKGVYHIIMPLMRRLNSKWCVRLSKSVNSI